VQQQRYALAELRTVAERCRTSTENDRPLADRMKQLNQLLREIDAELRRADKIYRSPPTPHPNAPNFRNR
jgi:hypothetical protein